MVAAVDEEALDPKDYTGCEEMVYKTPWISQLRGNKPQGGSRIPDRAQRSHQW